VWNRKHRRLWFVGRLFMNVIFRFREGVASMVARSVFGAMLLAFIGSTLVEAGEVKSGIPVGGRIGTYQGIKCGGAEDGVRVNQQLCYT